MAVRCWPEFFTDLGCSACGAMSLLSDALTPCSCEADVNGTITQLILQWISGEPAFGSDLVAFDAETDEAVLWHCGLAPLSMADPEVQPQATIHSNRRKPLLMQFPLKPGRVTIARLSEATGEFRLVIGGGEMLKAPPAFTGTSGAIRFDSGAAAVMDSIMREGLEHHIALAYGDHQDALESLARMLGLPVLRLWTRRRTWRSNPRLGGFAAPIWIRWIARPSNLVDASIEQVDCVMKPGLRLLLLFVTSLCASLTGVAQEID